MSDEEDFDDELPAIAVSARSDRSLELVMPCAGELAAERAREGECERELRRLRALCERLDPPAPPAPPAGLAHSDSSGSEGEAALATAVAALRVPPNARRELPGVRSTLLAALAPRLPPLAARLLQDYLRLGERATPAQLRRATDQMVAGVCGGGATAECVEAWPAAAALLAALLAAPPAPLRLRRALHHLLDDRLQPAQVAELARVVSAAVMDATVMEAAGAGAREAGAGAREAAARALLALGDAARGGGGAGSLRLAALLLRAALAALHPSCHAYLAEQESEESAECGGAVSAAAACGAVCGAWAALAPRAQYLALQLCARALAAGGGAGAAGQLLAGVAQAPRAAAPELARAPDRLKVAVGVARLRLLFSPRPP